MTSKKKATKEQKLFIAEFNHEQNILYTRSIKIKAELKQEEDNIRIAVIEFGRALKSLNDKRDELEKRCERITHAPENSQTAFLKEFGEDMFSLDLN
jgi:hypothetical protein